MDWWLSQLVGAIGAFMAAAGDEQLIEDKFLRMHVVTASRNLYLFELPGSVLYRAGQRTLELMWESGDVSAELSEIIATLNGQRQED